MQKIRKMKLLSLRQKLLIQCACGFSGDLRINSIIAYNDLQVLDVKKVSIPNNSFEIIVPEKYKDDQEYIDGLIRNKKNSVVGEKIKIPVQDKTIIVDTMFYTDEDDVSRDLRKVELNMLALPSDLQVGDYIDIRVLFPTGENYLVTVAKKIVDIGAGAESNSIMIEMTEEEQEKLNGAIIESYIYDSIKLYAVKYVNSKEQLFKEMPVDYVELYLNAVEELISGDYALAYEEAKANAEPLFNESGENILNESGEIMYEDFEVARKTEGDYTVEEIAVAANLKVDDTEAIRRALHSEPRDEAILTYYKLKTYNASKLLEPNYPVRREVAMVLSSNPNLVEEIRDKYKNIEELELQRQNLVDTSIKKLDEYTGELVEDTAALSNIAQNLSEEIQKQKNDRKQYLQNMIRNSMING